MTELSQQTRPPAAADSERVGPVEWVAIAVVAAGIGFLAAAHAPPFLKKPGLLLPVLGALFGWALGRWFAAAKMRSNRLLTATAAVATLVGQSLYSYESYRLAIGPQYAAWERLASEAVPAIPVAPPHPPDSPDEETPESRELRQRYEEFADRNRQARAEALEAERQKLTFTGYLHHRIPAQWGAWRAPWPVLFWLGEIGLGALLGAVVARHSALAGAAGLR